MNLDGGLAMTELAEPLRFGTATVAVVGLGYVGLSLAVALGRAGFRVRGIPMCCKSTSVMSSDVRNALRHLRQSRSNVVTL